ncbi:MAG: GH1 family beta-glucosidase [Desulfobacterota bacterium]|nr:GH1 family beta-glucosidase [Thermodesulfobacteriota bacterium]
MSFPNDFIWGAATSAYQIEGEEGRGPSIWDEFCKVAGVASVGRACDHYNRFAEDIRLMRDIGLRAYRFSVSWPRVLPNGRGTVNRTGLDFYDRLVDELLAAGIVPWVTLFHWDYPLALHRCGGWYNRDSAAWFADYVALVVDMLSDRVSFWFTLNEPNVYVACGYRQGIHAPGERLSADHAFTICHNLLRGNGMAVQAIRDRAKMQPWIGYALAPNPVPLPATDTPEDREAARRMLFTHEEHDFMSCTWWTDPVAWGRYPEEGVRKGAARIPDINAHDMALIAQPIDFIGLNIYFGVPCCLADDGTVRTLPLSDAHRRTGFGWPVTPACVYWGVRFFVERYGLPVVISENGAAYPDTVSDDGTVHDSERIEYLKEHLQWLHRACEERLPVRGYFLWSLLDNFEWAAGYTQRFGIVYVDFHTRHRTPKDSAWWYREVITSSGTCL